MNKSFAIRFFLLFFLPIFLLLNAALAEQSAVKEEVTTVAGTGNWEGAFGDGGQAKDANLKSPESVYVDSAGNVFIGEMGRYRVRKVAPDGVITTFAGNGFDAPPPAPGLKATEVGIVWPTGIVADGSGNIFVADQVFHSIFKIPSDGAKLELFVGRQDPQKVFIAPDGNLYVAGGEENQIYKVSPTGEVSVVAGNGRMETTGDGGLAVNAGVFWPDDVLMDKEGNIYFTNYQPGLVRKIDPHGIVTTFVGGGHSSSCNAVPATDCSLIGPNALEIDKNGNIYIASRREIFKVSPNGIITKLNSSVTPYNNNGLTCEGYSGEGGPLADANFCGIEDMFIDAAENLYIVDSGYHRVVKVNLHNIISGASLASGTEAAPQNTNSAGSGTSTPAETKPAIGGCGWDAR